MGDLFKKKKKESEDLYVNPKDLIVNMIKTRIKLQNAQNDKFASLPSFLRKQRRQLVGDQGKKERRRRRRRREKNWGFKGSCPNLFT